MARKGHAAGDFDAVFTACPARRRAPRFTNVLPPRAAGAVGKRARRRAWRILRALLIGVVVAMAMPAAAQNASEAEGDRVPGVPEPSIAINFPAGLADPGGMRAALTGRGINYAINYIGEVLANPTGGFAQGTFYDGRLELALNIDLDKAIGWKGLTFFTNAYQIHGDSISAADLGVLMPVSYIEAMPSTRLFELWLEQKLLDDHLSFRFGQLAADSDFLISKGAGAFINSTWGWPAIAGVNLPDGGPSYPLAAPGARLSFAPNDQLTILAGVYSGDPAGDCAEDLPQVCNPNGFSFPLNAPLVLAEAGYAYNQGKDQLPGTLKFGTWRLFGSFEQGAIGNNGLPIGLQPVPGQVTDHDYAFYAILDQMLYRLPGEGDPKGVAVFGRVIGAPDYGNMIAHYVEGGLTFTGMAAARPKDVLGIGFGYTGVSSQIIDFQKQQGDPVIANFEGMLEVSYTASIMQGFIVQPDFQYFWNPGGHSPDPYDGAKAVPDAVALGLRTTINY